MQNAPTTVESRRPCSRSASVLGTPRDGGGGDSASRLRKRNSLTGRVVDGLLRDPTPQAAAAWKQTLLMGAGAGQGVEMVTLGGLAGQERSLVICSDAGVHHI